MKETYTLSPIQADISVLDNELKLLNPVCLDILFKRGITTNDAIRSILFPSFQAAIQPLTCQDIKPAIEVLSKAVRENKHIVVYRDYDVDGITAGALAVECLSALGTHVDHYVNRREVDGFGICKNGIDNILKMYPDAQVIMTVDNGINGVNAIDYANSKGLTVVVTDHHEPGEKLPNAAAVIDLKRKDETYPFRDLCGCGLAFRVMLDLYRYMKKDPTPVFKTLDLVALATVADVVPLKGENRALLKEGLLRIESGDRMFFSVLLPLLNVKEVNAHYTLAFQIAPILNSLSRMCEDTSFAVDALLSNDPDWVRLQCSAFIDTNKVRKEMTMEQTELAISMAEERESDQVLVIYNDSFHEGIVGIIAGRLKELFWKPAIVLARGETGALKGSGRSLDEIPLNEALNACNQYLLTYGGHAKAAGLSLPAENLDSFRTAINAYAAERLGGKELRKETPLAAVLTENTLTEDLVHSLRILEPYGEGFPEPLFGLKAVPTSIQYMGAEQQHVKLRCENSGLSIIFWNKGKEYKNRRSLPSKFIGKPQLNIWNDNVYVQFVSAV